MQMEFRRILTGIGSRAGEPQHQSMIQGFAIGGAQPAQACMSWGRQATSQALHSLSGTRP
jgi:hypothetical protein